MKTQLLSRLLASVATVCLAVSLTGCSVSGGGKICSLDQDAAAGTTFSVNFVIDDSTETIEGTANVNDHGVGVNAKISFSEEDFLACIEAINIDEVQDFLNAAITDCLEEPTGPEEGAVLFGRYRLRGPGKKQALKDDFAAEGCFVGLYVDLGQPSTNGDGVAIALIDDNDLDGVFYSNCGLIKGGNIKVELLTD